MTTIKVRRGTATQWANAATVLAAGEPGLDTTNNVLKLGDGSTAWASLPVSNSGTYARLLTTDATSTAASGTLAAWHLTPVDATSASATWTLPAASAVTAGVEVAVKKADTTANTVTVSRAGSDLIFGTGSGSTTKTLTLAGEAITFVSDGVSKWTIQTSDTPSGVLASTYAPIAALYPTARIPSRATETSLTHFQSSHGYTFSAADASASLNDTTNFAVGTQGVSLVTDGAGTAALLVRGGQSLDLSAKTIKVKYRVEDDTHLVHIRLYAGDSGLGNSYLWEFHGAGPSLNNVTKSGEWSHITLSFADATVSGSPTRSSIAKLQLRAQDDNTGNKVTVRFAAMDTVPEPTTLWPNGLVSFAFDDTYQSHYTYARAALDKYGWAGTAYTIVDQVGQSGRMSLATLTQLQQVNGWEIASHAYTTAYHSSTNGYRDLSASALDTELRNCKAYMMSNGFLAANHFAIPKGEYDLSVIAAVQKYFSSARTTAARNSLSFKHETSPPAHPLRIRSQSGCATAGGVSVATVQALIDACLANKSWLVLTFHNIVASGAASDEALSADLTTIVDYVNTKGCAVRPVGAALAAM